MWSDYLRNRFVDDDDDEDDDGNDYRYEEPGSRLRKFDREDIPQSYDPREKARKRAADEEAAKQGGPKRRRRRGPQGRSGAGGDDDEEEVPAAQGIPGVAPADVAAAAAAEPAGPGVAGAAGSVPPNQRRISGINSSSRGRSV